MNLMMVVDQRLVLEVVFGRRRPTMERFLQSEHDSRRRRPTGD